MLNQPLIHDGRARTFSPTTQLPTMISPLPAYVINRQKGHLTNPATRTHPTIKVKNHFFAFTSVAFRPLRFLISCISLKHFSRTFLTSRCVLSPMLNPIEFFQWFNRCASATSTLSARHRDLYTASSWSRPITSTPVYRSLTKASKAGNLRCSELTPGKEFSAAATPIRSIWSDGSRSCLYSLLAPPFSLPRDFTGAAIASQSFSYSTVGKKPSERHKGLTSRTPSCSSWATGSLVSHKQSMRHYSMLSREIQNG